jgi:hypothetical protein
MSTSDSPPKDWSRRAKLIVSGIVILQLMAVFAEPFHFFTRSPVRGSSQAARPLREGMKPYVDFAYLNHGYFFFAPEPGPSHLIQASMKMPDGTTPTLRYPDKYAQWPRLLYHRHFMLAEFLNQLHVPPVDAAVAKQMPETEVNEWAEGRKRYEMVRQSMENHLKARYGATEASIERMEHILPGSTEVLEQGLPINDPRFYVILPDAPPSEPNGSTTPPLAFPSRTGGEKVEASP